MGAELKLMAMIPGLLRALVQANFRLIEIAFGTDQVRVSPNKVES
jgi:hypothetical protein